MPTDHVSQNLRDDSRHQALAGAGFSGKAWSSTSALVAALSESGDASPIYCHYPDALRRQIRRILSALPKPFYAVKANTLPSVLEAVVAEGVRCFDVASPTELRAVLGVDKGAVFAYMNPVKKQAAIQEAYQLGVRMFALDSMDELEKIMAVISPGRDGSRCTLIVRVALAPNRSVYDMTGKFGASHSEAVVLLKGIVAAGFAAGITFHVGSQCEHPETYVEAIESAAELADAAAVPIAVLDVGGGFPANYRGSEPELAAYGQAIEAAFAKRRASFGSLCVLQSEPGRSMVAETGSVLVCVELRRNRTLFLNEGVHGLLSELRWMPGFHPVRRIGAAGEIGEGSDRAPTEFSFAGPTCDSGDFMKGPYALPSDMKAGDWIEIGFLGAYCVELVTPFNGFGRYDIAVIQGAARWNEPEHLSESEN